ncbi:MAG: response regulator, partial [Deltaproteobacteria bacterium]|nr:response regulator [Deltaproteobacteria bacterium]
SFDRGELSAAFAAVTEAETTAASLRLAVGVACLLFALFLSSWVSRGLLRGFSALNAGLARFGSGSFAVPIPIVSNDELGDVAQQANRMAASLERLGEERNRTDWLKTGLAGLAQELRGELSLREVARRIASYWAGRLEAPAAALYVLEDDGMLRRLGEHGLSAESASLGAIFAPGEGLVGQAARATDITVISSPPADYLRVRSGLGEAAPHALVLVPLVLSNRVTGVVELALFKPWTPLSSDFVLATRETAAVALEVARARQRAVLLLAEKERQAERLRAQEEALRTANNELVEQKAALQRKAEELAAASAYKSQFLANMSHELRTPLNAIIGFSELLQDGVVPPGQQQQEFLGHILTSGRHLLQLINDVLDLAKVESGKFEFHPEPIDVNAVLGEVLAILRTTSATKRIRIETSVDPSLTDLVLDPARFKQVLYNYLSNALKFTPADGRIQVRVLAAGTGSFRLEVEDMGPGISPTDLEKLFSEFQQVGDQKNKPQGGTGLGLALTKKLVEAQGGAVGVRSRLGWGSTFHAVLPRHSLVGAARFTQAPDLSHLAGVLSVLVVEDDTAEQKVLASVLEREGYAVEVAATGAEALARCRAHTFDAITLDLLLPDMSGLDLLEKIRNETSNRNVPVIVITVVAEHGAVAGFAVQEVLSKPTDANALRSALARAGLAPERPGGILVVDDDASARNLMLALLQQLGYEARSASDGVLGLDAVKQRPPAAVVLDLVMPEMDGFQFLQRFRERVEVSKVPVIVWTAKELSQDELAHLRTSASAIVSKAGGGGAAVVAELRSFLPSRLN